MSPVDVLLLTQAQCDFCDRAKALLERLGSDFELRVSELDLRSPDGRRIAESHGVLFAPGILLDGELVSYGRPSERRLRSELRERYVNARSNATTPRSRLGGIPQRKDHS